MIRDWNWYLISMNTKMEDVINNPNLPWYKNYLSLNQNITIEVIRTYLLNPIVEWEWSWELISKYISIDEIINNPNEKWHEPALIERGIISRRSSLSYSILDVIKKIYASIPTYIRIWLWKIMSRKEVITTQSLIRRYDLLSRIKNNYRDKDISLCIGLSS
jgi:uncharacterized protein (UPF0147 family)